MLLPQKGGKRGQDVGTLVKNAGLATSSVICGGLEPEPRALVVLGRGRSGKEVQEPGPERGLSSAWPSQGRPPGAVLLARAGAPPKESTPSSNT